MNPRPTYRLYKYTDTAGVEQFASFTSAAVARTLLRACEAHAQRHGASVLYEVRPALPPEALEQTP